MEIIYLKTEDFGEGDISISEVVNKLFVFDGQVFRK